MVDRELCDYENGLKFDEEGVDFAKHWGKPSPEISARLNVCLDLLHLGEQKQVLGLLDRIEKQINAGSFGFTTGAGGCGSCITRGLCYFGLDEPAKALVLADEGLPLAEINISRKYIALNHELRGRAMAELGDRDGAISDLRNGYFSMLKTFNTNRSAG